ncbi:MAG: helix-turn-helix domain-containing protein [Woeseiaceae bacterium]
MTAAAMNDPNPTPVKSDDPAHAEPADNALEQAIGRQVRRFRRQLEMSIADLCNATGLSQGMVSKIENGNTSPSLATLSALSEALNVPFTALFRAYDEQRDAVHVRAGDGLVIERRGTRAGHQYQLLGHSLHGNVSVEPYLITLEEGSEVFPLFQHPGIEFIHMLSGSMVYRHGSSNYELNPGDSLFFDADVTHGPDRLEDLPVRFISVMSRATQD